MSTSLLSLDRVLTWYLRCLRGDVLEAECLELLRQTPQLAPYFIQGAEVAPFDAGLTITSPLTRDRHYNRLAEATERDDVQLLEVKSIAPTFIAENDVKKGVRTCSNTACWGYFYSIQMTFTQAQRCAALIVNLVLQPNWVILLPLAPYRDRFTALKAGGRVLS